MPATNPWNPFGTRFWSTTGAANTDGTARLTGTPSAVSITNKRLTDLMDRTATVTNTIYRGVARLRGKLFNNWTWESAVLYSQAHVTDEEAGPSRKSLLIAAINQTDPLKAFNPFTRTFAVQNGGLVVTGPYVNSSMVQSGFRSKFIREGFTKLASGDVRAAGDVLSIWGGNAIGAAVGGEWRYEGYDDLRPAYAGLNPAGSGLDEATNDFLGFSPTLTRTVRVTWRRLTWRPAYRWWVINSACRWCAPLSCRPRRASRVTLTLVIPPNPSSGLTGGLFLGRWCAVPTTRDFMRLT